MAVKTVVPVCTVVQNCLLFLYGLNSVLLIFNVIKSYYSFILLLNNKGPTCL